MDRIPGTSRSQNRLGGPSGRGPPPPFHDRREPRRGGPGHHYGPIGNPGWRGHPGSGQFRQHHPPGLMNGRGLPIPLHGPPPPPPRQAVPPPPPIVTHRAPQAFSSNVGRGRGRGPQMQRPTIQREMMGQVAGPHGRNIQQHPSGPFTRHELPLTRIPPPPPPLQAYQIRMHNSNSLPTFQPPSATFIPQPNNPSVHPTIQTISHISNNDTPVWSEFSSPTGLKYYYNSVTKESTYEKPAGFVSPQARPATHQQGTVTSSTWTEHIDGATGKKYYSDGITTTWEQPASFKAPSLSLPAATTNTVTEKTSATVGNDNEGDPPRKKQKTGIRPKSDFASKEEAIAAFKGLLIAKDVSPTLKWTELMKLYSSDSRWIMCEDALTTGERKQALAEYQTKRANELRLLERQEKIRAREAFMELLTDSLPKLKSVPVWETTFKDIRDYLVKDDRFHAVAEESTRESLFLDFCEEVRKREERRKRDQRREARDNFIDFLTDKQQHGYLNYASTWESFVASLSESDKDDERFKISTHVSNFDRETYFAEFVLGLKASEEEKHRRVREAQRRAEQGQRDLFEDFLCRLARDEGKLFPWSGWADLESEITTDPSYGALHEQNSDAPIHIFNDFVGEWNSRYCKDRDVLAVLMKPTPQTEFVVDCETTYETFTNAILETAQSFPSLLDEVISIINQDEPVSNAKMYFKEIQSRNETARFAHRRAGALRRSHYDSSEDEGEINEDIEIEETNIGRIDL